MARKQTVIERVETAMQTHGALVLVDPLVRPRAWLCWIGVSRGAQPE